jgi:YVTN family beta-propeller protein
VVNGNAVTPLSVSTNTTGTPVSVGTPAGAAAITPDASTAYLITNGGTAVTPLAVATNTPGTPIPIGGLPSESAGANAIAVTPNGATVYVVNEGSPLGVPGSTVTAINTSTDSVTSTIPVGSLPRGIAITPNGSTAYVTNGFSGDITPINTATNTPGPPIPTGGVLPSGIAITPNGSTAFVANAVSATVTPIDLSTSTPETPIPVGPGPNAVAITPDGSTAYVTCANGAVTPIDIPTDTVEPPIAAGSGYAIAITPDGATAYVTGNNPAGTSGTVTPINLSTKTAGSPISVGLNPTGIAITPDQAPTARLAVAPKPAGSPTGFDASASTVASGKIASYVWTFGDGTSATTTVPTITHAYGTPGTYRATVTETDSAGTSTTQVFTGQTVSRNGGPSATASQAVDIPPPPSVVDVTPRKGPSFGFTLVRISGNDLTSGRNSCFWLNLSACDVGVHFGTREAFVLFAAPTTVFVVSPPGKGTVDVTVTVDGATSATSPHDRFTYVNVRF